MHDTLRGDYPESEPNYRIVFDEVAHILTIGSFVEWIDHIRFKYPNDHWRRSKASLQAIVHDLTTQN